MAAQSTLVLRDIHQPPAPPWWPPAPGWWLIAALLLAALAAWGAWRWQHRRRRAARAALFDAEVAAATTPAEEVAVMSGLLRRAARQCDAAADRLQGEAWLAWLDGGDAARPFTTGAGRVLLDGGFRPDVGRAEVAALRPLARARFLQLLESGPHARGVRRRSASAKRAPLARARARPADPAPSRAQGTAVPPAMPVAGDREPGFRRNDGPGPAPQDGRGREGGQVESGPAEHANRPAGGAARGEER
jgi:hypothetical protein